MYVGITDKGRFVVQRRLFTSVGEETSELLFCPCKPVKKFISMGDRIHLTLWNKESKLKVKQRPFYGFV